MKGNKNVLGIRADANETVAAGHIMRCITIAKQLKALGEDVIFFVADEYAHSMLRQAEMNYVCLRTAWNSLEEELPVLSAELKKAGCEKLLVDSYKVTPAYLGALKKECKIICIDDMFETVYPADMIINYNAYHTQFPYQEAYNGNTELLLGTRYVPLRKEFSAYRDIHTGKTTQNVLLSCGGGDLYNALSGILSEAVKRDGLKEAVFHTIVGRFNKNTKELEKLAEQYQQIKLYYDVSNMAELMSGCEIAVSAAGTVLYELCAMQIPAVFFVCADNQKYDSTFFAEEDRMLFTGDIRSDRTGCIKQICDGIERLMLDSGLRKEMKRKLHEVTDGRGAERIAEKIKALGGKYANECGGDHNGKGRK